MPHRCVHGQALMNGTVSPAHISVPSTFLSMALWSSISSSLNISERFLLVDLAHCKSSCTEQVGSSCLAVKLSENCSIQSLIGSAGMFERHSSIRDICTPL